MKSSLSKAERHDPVPKLSPSGMIINQATRLPAAGESRFPGQVMTAERQIIDT